MVMLVRRWSENQRGEEGRRMEGATDAGPCVLLWLMVSKGM